MKNTAFYLRCHFDIRHNALRSSTPTEYPRIYTQVARGSRITVQLLSPVTNNVPSRLEECIPRNSVTINVPSRLEECVPRNSVMDDVPSRLEECVRRKSVMDNVPSRSEECVRRNRRQFSTLTTGHEA